jgi:hypothetical protein
LNANKQGNHQTWKKPFDHSRHLARSHRLARASMVFLAVLSLDKCGWFSNICD